MASKKRPTQRTLEHLRAQGYLVDVVERFIKVPKHPGGGIRRDLFGIIDILSIQNGKIVGIQTTSGNNHNAHYKKLVNLSETLTDDPDEQEAIDRQQTNLTAWLQAGCIYEVWSWTKKKGKWENRVDRFKL